MFNVPLGRAMKPQKECYNILVFKPIPVILLANLTKLFIFNFPELEGRRRQKKVPLSIVVCLSLVNMLFKF